MTKILTNVNDIFEHGNKHLQTKLKYFSKPQGMIVKYIVSKLRLFKGNFYQSYSTISTELNVSVSTIKRCVKKMQELEIVTVSNRFEDGRRTTNIIRLLEFKPFEIVKNIVEVVKEVTSKVVEVVKETVQNTEVSKKRACNKRFNASTKQSQRQSAVITVNHN